MEKTKIIEFDEVHACRADCISSIQWEKPWACEPEPKILVCGIPNGQNHDAFVPFRVNGTKEQAKDFIKQWKAAAETGYGNEEDETKTTQADSRA
jgi:hypothetical protein